MAEDRSERDAEIEDIIEKKVEERMEEKKQEIREELKQELRKDQDQNNNSGKDDKIGRREFLKKVGAGAIGLGALSLAPAASKITIGDTGIIKDGTSSFWHQGNSDFADNPHGNGQHTETYATTSNVPTLAHESGTGSASVSADSTTTDTVSFSNTYTHASGAAGISSGNEETYASFKQWITDGSGNITGMEVTLGNAYGTSTTVGYGWNVMGETV